MTRNRWSGSHRRLSEKLRVNAIGKTCHFCGKPMLPGQPLDLDHTDDGRGYRGVTHSSCNRSAGARRGQDLRKLRIPRRRIMFTEPAIGVEIAVDRSHTSIAAAGPRADATAVELVGWLDGSDTAASVAEIIDSYPKVRAVVIDPRSPAATLIDPLREMQVTVTEPSSRDVAIAHGRFIDELKAGRVKITSHPALDAAAQHALARPLAGGEALERRKPLTDTSPLVAAELAVWAVLNGGSRAAIDNVW